MTDSLDSNGARTPANNRVPHVNPVGIVEYPDDYAGSPRRFSSRQRLFVGLLLFFFAAATIGTSILSIGAYCLTSDGGDTRALQEGIERLVGGS
ncbi:MAG: hypothetical protein AAF657_39610 [Acidobacteriota bacterium]